MASPAFTKVSPFAGCKHQYALCEPLVTVGETFKVESYRFRAFLPFDVKKNFCRNTPHTALIWTF